MFTTTTQLTTTSADHDAHVRVLLSDVNSEVRELRMLARAGDLPERDAQLLLKAAEQRAARRRARLLTLGRDAAIRQRSSSRPGTATRATARPSRCAPTCRPAACSEAQRASAVAARP